jgi:hypothetical protein
MSSAATRPPFALPYLLEWHIEKPGSDPIKVIADGISAPAGWTIGRFETRDEMVSFMKQHPRARMPCWGRVERGEI